jgi:hypothetical protein
MIFHWLKSKSDARAIEPTTVDTDGHVLREIDDVILLREVNTDPTIPEELRFFRGVIPEGAIGTIIIIHKGASGIEMQLEFNVDGKMSFAYVSEGDVRLHRRREEKLKHA